jgi:predicted metal-dependent hydrolase
MPQPPQKRRLKDLKGPLAEPPRTPARLIAFAEGVARFDAGAYWDAHEAWERAWLDFGNGPEDDAEIVLRGLIQLAAALHARDLGRPRGARSGLAKAEAKLALATGPFWGLDLDRLNHAVAAAGGDPAALGRLTLGPLA